ncbi:MAG TPA: VOC family protein, partial [Actinomycetota bacterium]|nr:VOC family protein [Actinomycetota bacterium]
MPEFSGLSHLTLTVSDVEKSTAWWTELLGIQVLFDGDEDGIKFTVNIHPSGLIFGLRSPGPASCDLSPKIKPEGCMFTVYLMPSSSPSKSNWMPSSS